MTKRELSKSRVKPSRNTTTKKPKTPASKQAKTTTKSKALPQEWFDRFIADAARKRGGFTSENRIQRLHSILYPRADNKSFPPSLDEQWRNMGDRLDGAREMIWELLLRNYDLEQKLTNSMDFMLKQLESIKKYGVGKEIVKNDQNRQALKEGA